MKITIEIPDSDVKEICRVTGESKKGPAIRKLLMDALMLKRRERLAQKFISGEWGVELKGFEATRAAEQQTEAQSEQSWPVDRLYPHALAAGNQTLDRPVPLASRRPLGRAGQV